MLQIDSVQLAALSMAYQRAKDAMQSAVDSAAQAVNEFPGAEQVQEESAPEVVSEPSDNLSLSLSAPSDTISICRNVGIASFLTQQYLLLLYS